MGSRNLTGQCVEVEDGARTSKASQRATKGYWVLRCLDRLQPGFISMPNHFRDRLLGHLRLLLYSPYNELDHDLFSQGRFRMCTKAAAGSYTRQPHATPADFGTHV